MWSTRVCSLDNRMWSARICFIDNWMLVIYNNGYNVYDMTKLCKLKPCNGLPVHLYYYILSGTPCTNKCSQPNGANADLCAGAGPWFNIKMSSYQYRKSHCGNETILRPSYLHNWISYTGNTTSLYWIRAHVSREGKIKYIPDILCLVLTCLALHSILSLS